MTNIARERLITNKLLLDHLGMWDEFDIKSVDDNKTVRYYNRIMNHIDEEIEAGLKWLDSEEAEKYFKEESQYHQKVFQSLEDEWDSILESKYDSIEALLSEIYQRGKAKGYTDMREHVRYTEADKLALEFVKNYNFDLIRRIDDDVRNEIKNKIISGFLAGDNPNLIAPKIQAIADEQLEGSTFTPRQRATMIAKTEISRVQNTGMLQSYVNEGYTEVKILTAEDNNVCATCLEYAYEFNKDDDLIYGNRGKEKIHNIKKLLDGEAFPPFHPNCRCTYLSVWESKNKETENPDFIKLTPPEYTPKQTENTVLSDDEVNNMSFEELAEYYDAEYQGIQVYDYDDKKYHTFVQTYDNGKSLTIRMEVGAVKSYTKKGWVTPNEIINEVFKVPEFYKRQTNEIWFKNTNQGVRHQPTKSGYDTLGPADGGYNTVRKFFTRDRFDDPNHIIVINPKHFKGARGGLVQWRKPEDEARDWKMTIYHEFTHSIDVSREIWDLKEVRIKRLSENDHYKAVESEEPYFTWYANKNPVESFAEHGGYINRMLANPSEQHKLITLQKHVNGEIVNERINFEEYKKLYPKHYEYFTKLLNGEIPLTDLLSYNDQNNYI